MENKAAAGSNAKEVVLAFIDTLNKEDFAAARKYISDDMSFKGVMGTRDGGDVYMKDMSEMKLKYALKKFFTDGADDVCIIYDLTQSGITLLSCGWYHVANGKIKTLQALFDPRPLLETADKK